MKMPSKLTPSLRAVYSLNDVLNNLGLTVAPRLFVVDARFSDPNEGAKPTPLNYDHVLVEDFLSIAGIANSNWRYNGADKDGVALFSFVATHDDIERYFDFERRINAWGEIETYEHWSFPRGYRREQPFQYRVEKTLYATQGGGTAIRVDNEYVFVSVPEWGQPGEFQAGERIPEDWSVAPCGTFRPLTVDEQDMAFNEGRLASLDCEDDKPPFESEEADAHWSEGFRYGEQEKREQSARIAYG